MLGWIWKSFFCIDQSFSSRESNKAGDVYGKMLVLTFEDNEDDMMNRILSLINTKEEVIEISCDSEKFQAVVML